MSRDEFFRTYFTGQKELALMAAMGASERARFLSKVLGYEKLRLAQDMISDRRRTLNAEITGLRAGMPDPEAVEKAMFDARERVAQATNAAQTAEHRHTMADSVLTAIAPKWELAQQNRDKAQAIAAEIAAHEREETSLRRELERVASELRTIGESRAELSRLQRSLEPMSELREELALLRDPTTLLVELRGQAAAPGAVGRVLWADGGGGLLLATQLPPPPPGKVYALWTLAGDAPRAAGVFVPDESGRATLRVAADGSGGPVRVLSVTVEPAGGASAPTGAVALAPR